ncbi:MAG TPA: hypothetical protein VH436_33460 [Vicinamibacterales bacterium]|jgi:hypothetical protein
MSRVIYTELPPTADQEALRIAHQVRIVSVDEEGTGVNNQPGGVYGFTYSPGLANAPLFAIRRYRTYETHKLPSGEIFVIGFTKADIARALSTANDEMTLQIHPQPEGDHGALVTIRYSQIRHHKQYAAPNQDGFTVTVVPGA